MVKIGIVIEVKFVVCDEEGLGSIFSVGGFSCWDLFCFFVVSIGLLSDREFGEY